MSISGALVQTPLELNAFTGIELTVNRQWLLAWVTRRAALGILAVEWMALAPDAVVQQLEMAAVKLAPLTQLAVA